MLNTKKLHTHVYLLCRWVLNQLAVVQVALDNADKRRIDGLLLEIDDKIADIFKYLK